MNATEFIPLTNPDCEHALLGAVLLDPRQWAIVEEHFPQDELDEPLFSSNANEIIWKAMYRIGQRKMIPDLTLVATELHDRGELDVVGGAVYIAQLIDWLYSLNQVPQYCQIVREKWQRRRALRAANRIGQDAVAKGMAPDEIVAELERTMLELSYQDQSQPYTTIEDSINEEIIDLSAKRAQKIERLGHKTGFNILDNYLCGLRPGNLVLIAARPSVGKTALALNIAANLALRQRVPVAFQSLEMGRMGELNARIIAQEAQIDGRNVMNPKSLDYLQWQEVLRIQEYVKGAPLVIDDSAGLKVGEIKRRARQLKRLWPELAVYIVDYLQLVHGDAKQYSNREREVSEISLAMKELAKELQLTVIALSQLSRESEKRAGSERIPRLSDLRDSGSLEQDADIVIMLHRQSVSAKAANHAQAEEISKRRRTLLILKNRNGPCGEIKMGYTPEHTLFNELAN